MEGITSRHDIRQRLAEVGGALLRIGIVLVLKRSILCHCWCDRLIALARIGSEHGYPK